MAIASLALPGAPTYDSWAWLTWGREVAHLELHTVGGPAWKPLPVLVTTLAAPLGDAGPVLWLLVVRAAGLLALVGTYRVAARLAGRVAGVVAAGLLVLTPDGAPRFTRLVLEGHSAPVTAALTAWAIERHLAGRHGTALMLGTALALDRPEAWPFLALYAAWCWRAVPRRRSLVTGALALVPVLWFGGDLWGSGDPVHGAGVAQVLTDDGSRVLDALARVAEVVVPVAWLPAAGATWAAWRRRDRVPIVLAAGAIAWFALVVSMSAAFGYAATSRFLLPGAVVVCVLGGVGTAGLVRAARSPRIRAAFATAVVVVGAPFVADRAVGFPSLLREVEARQLLVDDLDVAIRGAGGRDAVLRCGAVSIDDAGTPRMALAWKLDVPLAAIHSGIDRGRGLVFARWRRGVRRLERSSPRTVATVARSEVWHVVALDCPGPNGS